jgi:hypothetical protein
MNSNTNSENPRPIVNVDSGLKALEVTRLDRASDSEGDSIGLCGTVDPIGLIKDSGRLSAIAVRSLVEAVNLPEAESSDFHQDSVNDQQ